MAVPILISKQKGRKIFKDDYLIGWLRKDEDKGYWMTWCGFSSKEKALKCAREQIEEKGERDIFISDEPLETFLTLEQINNLKKLN